MLEMTGGIFFVMLAVLVGLLALAYYHGKHVGGLEAENRMLDEMVERLDLTEDEDYLTRAGFPHTRSIPPMPPVKPPAGEVYSVGQSDGSG